MEKVVIGSLPYLFPFSLTQVTPPHKHTPSPLFLALSTRPPNPAIKWYPDDDARTVLDTSLAPLLRPLSSPHSLFPQQPPHPPTLLKPHPQSGHGTHQARDQAGDSEVAPRPGLFTRAVELRRLWYFFFQMPGMGMHVMGNMESPRPLTLFCSLSSSLCVYVPLSFFLMLSLSQSLTLALLLSIFGSLALKPLWSWSFLSLTVSVEHSHVCKEKYTYLSIA